MNSSSGESTVPLDFNISSSCEDSGNLIIYTEDCPLCIKGSRNFYCKTCIINGEFVHSNGISSEKFSDKKKRFLNLKKEKLSTEKSCENVLATRANFIKLMGEKEIVEERIKILKLLIDETNKSACNKKKMISSVKNANAEKSAKLHRYRVRVHKMISIVYSGLFEGKRVKDSLIRHQDELKKERRNNIKQLVANIFPITSIEPSEKHNEDSLVSVLEEACRTAYVQGKWVSSHSLSERQYCIVAPTLPASGDYTAYNDWVAANKDCVPSTSNNTSVDFNPAYRIGAALTYTAQLVNMLAYFLDVWLPAKLCYSDFCSNELSKSKFTKKVARLNWNVLHLCLSQNVKPHLLKPESTLTNVLYLLDQTVSDLGRSLTPDLNPEESKVLEDALRPLLEVDDTDDSGDEGLSFEWEAVPSCNGLPESEPVHTNQSQQVSSASVTGSLFTSTAASIASLLRWNR